MSFAHLAQQRRSVRKFTNQAVETEKLDAIIEAGRLAPSACNKHPSRVLVCNTPELLEKASLAASSFARNKSVFGAPVVLLVCALDEIAWVRHADGLVSGDIDTSIVTDQMMMQAEDLGLGSCWVCHFDPNVAREVFGLANNLRPIHMLALGYAADTPADAAARERRRITKEDFLL